MAGTNGMDGNPVTNVRVAEATDQTGLPAGGGIRYTVFYTIQGGTEQTAGDFVALRGPAGRDGDELWEAATQYADGDVVIHPDDNNVFSYYVANGTPTVGTEPQNEQARWHLVRSGIVSVAANAEASAGLTGNDVLRLTGGNGIDITRDPTSAHFTIAAHSTAHSDAEDFNTGFEYTYLDVGTASGVHHGVVGGSITGGTGIVQFANAESTASGRYQQAVALTYVDDSPGGVTTFNNAVAQGDIVAFAYPPRDSGNQDAFDRLFPGATAAQQASGIIIYAERAENVPQALVVLQTDPAVGGNNEMQTLFGTTQLDTLRTYTPGVGFNPFTTLDVHTAPSPATWAEAGNTDDIPRDKFGNIVVTRGLTREELTGNDDLTIGLPSGSTTNNRLVWDGAMWIAGRDDTPTPSHNPHVNAIITPGNLSFAAGSLPPEQDFTHNFTVADGIAGDGITNFNIDPASIMITDVHSRTTTAVLNGTDPTGAIVRVDITDAQAGTITVSWNVSYTATVNGVTTNHNPREVRTITFTEPAAHWFTNVSTTAPTDLLASADQGVFAEGDSIQLMGTEEGQSMYVWVPNSNVSTALFTTTNPSIFYDPTNSGVVSTNHTRFDFGDIGNGRTATIRIGRV